MIVFKWLSLTVFWVWICDSYGATTLHAPFNMAGLVGNITFHQENPTDNVTISVHLISLIKEARSFAWGIYTFPIMLDRKAPCSSSEVGRTFHDLSKRHDFITVPLPDSIPQVFYDTEIKLRGIKTIWSRSLVLRDTNTDGNNKERACTNIVNENRLQQSRSEDVKTIEAVFTSPVAGKIIIRQNADGETSIFTNVFHTTDEYKKSSNHEWKILASDFVDKTESSRKKSKCEYLQTLFEQGNINDSNCSRDDHQNCKYGDLTKKHGEVIVGSGNSRYSKKFYIDTNLPLTATSGSRDFYVVLYEEDKSYRIMACAIMVTIKAKVVKALFDSDGVKGFIRFSQRYRMDPTIVTVELKNLRGRGSGYHIHVFPVPLRLNANYSICEATGDHYNPFELDISKSPPAGHSTNDMYEIGDLSGKYGYLDSENYLEFLPMIYPDFNLPLFGIYSIIGRSIVINRPNGNMWICSNIGYPGSTTTAHATFVHPVVGRVVLKQESRNHWGETTVHAWLSYSDGTMNKTENHRWHVHEHPAGKDFFNWTKRCESAGKKFNPYNVGTRKSYDRVCNPENPLRCELGDISGKYGRLILTSTHDRFGRNQLFYTDVHLPLTGPNSIVGRSLVIHDDQAPPHRGDRLACTSISYYHHLKASVKTWAVGRGVDSNVTGLLEFTQQDPIDPTETKVLLNGLGQLASGYHIHMVPVPRDKEFPCTGDSVYGHFNPFNVNVSLLPFPGIGSVDQYEVGDLSGKYGWLDGKDSEESVHFDLNLPLHGQRSIMGRSVVVHQKDKNQRWVCGTIEPEYDRKHGVEMISAIASLDDPQSFVQGYVRMRQLKYPDGSASDTWIEVNLKYPGKYDRNLTTGHRWAVFVNQVGADAVEKVEKVRCIAAGYMWNPYNVKTDDELYKIDCGFENPFRCAMGDLTGKHGVLQIGGQKKVFSDVSLPLVGNFSVLQRSLVIFSKNGGINKVACANIKHDVKLVYYVSVKLHPGFTSANFMNRMRELLNASDWLVIQDRQTEKETDDGQCMRLKVNFYGPEAYKLQKEFSNLLTLGSVQRRTRTGLKLVKTYYRGCDTEDDSKGAVMKLSKFLHIGLVIILLSNLHIV